MENGFDVITKQGVKVLKKYTGTEKHVVVPNGIVQIDSEAFKKCVGIESVILPESLGYIGRKAFIGCEGLRSVAILSDKFEIEQNTFDHCLCISSITYKRGAIGERRFPLSKRYKEVECHSFDKYTIVTTDKSWSLSENHESEENLIELTGHSAKDAVVIVPYGVDKICKETFANDKLITEVYIPDSVKIIEESVFAKCCELISVRLPEGISEISSGMFNGCEKLSSIVLPQSVTSIGEYAFNTCVNLDRISMGSGIKSIGAGSFFFCEKLASFLMAEGIESIGDHAFSFSGLNSICIPGGLHSIGDYAFSSCFKLTNVRINNGIKRLGNGMFSGCICLKTICVPQNLEKIGKETFDSCERIETIEFVGDSAMEVVIVNSKFITVVEDVSKLCLDILRAAHVGIIEMKGNELKLLRAPQLGNMKIPYGVTRIGERAFFGNENMKKIAIPDTVTTIDKGAFAGCSGIKGITIPSGVRRIEKGTFMNCVSLRSITFLGNVEEICDYAFYGCSELYPFGVPNSLISIGNYAFYGCNKLDRITLPQGIKEIGIAAFANCSELAVVNMPENVHIAKDAFCGTPRDIADNMIGVQKNVTPEDILGKFDDESEQITDNRHYGSKEQHDNGKELSYGVAEQTENDPVPPEKIDVFISYKSEDTVYAVQVYDFLVQNGIKPFLSEISLPDFNSSEYAIAIDLALEKSTHMVVVTTSRNHAESKWVQYEWQTFYNEKLSGRKNGNLLTIIAGGMTINQLPIKLRQLEVFDISEMEKSLTYLGKRK